MSHVVFSSLPTSLQSRLSRGTVGLREPSQAADQLGIRDSFLEAVTWELGLEKRTECWQADKGALRTPGGCLSRNLGVLRVPGWPWHVCPPEQQLQEAFGTNPRGSIAGEGGRRCLREGVLGAPGPGPRQALHLIR